MDELERIRARYLERDGSTELSGFWTLDNPVVVHLIQERERTILRGMARTGIALSDCRLLDVGCGRGREFASYLRWGAMPHNLFGVDLSEQRVRDAQALGIGQVVLASGTALPLETGSFDVVVQNVVFSSIVDIVVKHAMANEMLRVLRPGGWILWYDAARSASRDVHFNSVPRAEIESLFPGVCWDWQRVTTHLGLIRRIHGALGERAMRAFDLLDLFKTHLLGWGRKP